MDKKIRKLENLAKLIRYYIISSTTAAGSGHPSSSLSATELMTALFFNGFYRYDLKNPQNPNNDRLIFSKGHASPLFYALYTAADAISEKELLTLRKFGSRLEGHPTMDFPYTEAATGSLGQGLSIGSGIAIAAKYLSKIKTKTFVLLGDSEMAEGSNWEAAELASHYKLDNLIAILDINRLGQRGETLFGHDIDSYSKKLTSFGWHTIKLQNGHDLKKIITAYSEALKIKDKPVAIIAKTIKGRGVKEIEDKNGWHGVALKPDLANIAITSLGEINKDLRGIVTQPKKIQLEKIKSKKIPGIQYPNDQPVSTRKAYGNALNRIYPKFPKIVSLDAETSNSTFAADFGKNHPERFFEMFIAEQNMVSAASGLARVGQVPFVSTFGAFLTRAYDQIRMCQYSNSNVKFIGSHAGVSIGEDGASQMALEDIAMFRSIIGSTVLYPSDAISCENLVEEAAKIDGIVYIRTTRKDTPILYKNDEQFPLGGSKTLKTSSRDMITVITAGITIHEAFKAYEILKQDGVFIRIIDLYSIKPIDTQTLEKAAKETGFILTVEDHHLEGGLGEAVKSALASVGVKIYSLYVDKIPHSGKPDELLKFEEISADAIVKKVYEIIKK